MVSLNNDETIRTPLIDEDDLEVGLVGNRILIRILCQPCLLCLFLTPCFPGGTGA